MRVGPALRNGRPVGEIFERRLLNLCMGDYSPSRSRSPTYLRKLPQKVWSEPSYHAATAYPRSILERGPDGEQS